MQTSVASEIHDGTAVSRSSHCRPPLPNVLAGAVPALFLLLFLCYACVIRALFLRYSCVIRALFLRYSCVILALLLRYSCVILAFFLRYPAAILALFFWLSPRHRPPLGAVFAESSGSRKFSFGFPWESGLDQNRPWLGGSVSLIFKPDSKSCFKWGFFPGRSILARKWPAKTKTLIRPLLPQHRRRVARSGLAMGNPK